MATAVRFDPLPRNLHGDPRFLALLAKMTIVPLIDIGMDVRVSDDDHTLCGQVITSLPGQACMRCLGFLNESAMKAEAGRYGNGGDRPQVIWPNGVLASTAIGLAALLLLKWHRHQTLCPYLVYDGNVGSLSPSPRLPHVPSHCVHFDQHNAFGDPAWPRPSDHLGS